MPPPPSNPYLWPFDLEIGVRIASKVGNLPSNFQVWARKAFGFSNYSLCTRRTDGRTDKINAYCPFPTGRGIITPRLRRAHSQDHPHGTPLSTLQRWHQNFQHLCLHKHSTAANLLLFGTVFRSFLPRDAMRSPDMLSQDVCLSGRLFVTRRYSVEMAKGISSNFFTVG